MATVRTDHTFRLTRWPWVNWTFIILLIVFAAKPFATFIGRLFASAGESISSIAK